MPGSNADTTFAARVLHRDYPSWELLGRDVDGCLFARLPDQEPAVIAFGEDIPDLLYECGRKLAVLEGRYWPEKY